MAANISNKLKDVQALMSCFDILTISAQYLSTEV